MVITIEYGIDYHYLFGCATDFNDNSNMSGSIVIGHITQVNSS